MTGRHPPSYLARRLGLTIAERVPVLRRDQRKYRHMAIASIVRESAFGPAHDVSLPALKFLGQDVGGRS